MTNSARWQIEVDRIEAARKEAIENGHEALTMDAAAALYGIASSAARHAALRHEEAVQFTIAIGGRDLKFLSKSWADAYWRTRDGYEDRLRALREASMTCWIASAGGMWLLLGMEPVAQEVQS